MTAQVRKSPASVYANVGVYDGVPIEATVDPDLQGGEIRIGDDNADVILVFADPESMELLAEVAAEGARVMRERAARLGPAR